MLNIFGRSAEIEIALDDTIKNSGRKLSNINYQPSDLHTPRSLPLFYDGESISGKVNINLKAKKLEYKGIQIEVIGVIELFGDKSNQYEFLSEAILLAGPEVVTTNRVYDFSFNNVNKPHESYSGINVSCRYFLRVRIVKMLADQVKEQDFIVHTIAQYSEDQEKQIKMEVGIEGSLHIEFLYKKSKYHLEDIIVGKIYFMMVRLKIKHMELCIVRKESAGFGQNQYNEPDIVAKYDIMDGPPNRGEEIPLRLYLKPYASAGKITPTMKEVAKRFSVRYFLHLKLVDEDERTYYKQQEIHLWRKPLETMGLNMYSSRSHEIGNCNDLREQNIRKKELAAMQKKQEEDDYDGEEAAF